MQERIAMLGQYQTWKRAKSQKKLHRDANTKHDGQLRAESEAELWLLQHASQVVEFICKRVYTSSVLLMKKLLWMALA